MNDTGIALQRTGKYFAIMRPSGRCSRYVFRSPYRAAEHVMRAAKCTYWPRLAELGVIVIPVEIDD
jgi:hypothetical protein